MSLANVFSLAGKVALVTGAGSGIGQQVARQLDALGAQVVATDIDLLAAEATFAQLSNGAVALRHDVCEEADWASVMGEVERRFGKLDILVNNAGIMLPKPFAEAPLEVLRRQQRVNVESVYIGMQAALPLLDAAVAGGAPTASIVNVSSIYGKVAGACFSAYSATKGAVRAMSKAVANELVGRRIRVNVVMPGPIATNLSASWDPPRHADGSLMTPEEGLALWTSLIPMGRLGEAGDIAPLVAYLASDAASFVTGSEFIADGGYTAV
jgi:NAD(P)-dependent dehydrogenase (short-subunit alcohol dehydrogenase family)